MLAPRRLIVNLLALSACASEQGRDDAREATALQRSDLPSLSAPPETMRTLGPENGILEGLLDDRPRSRRLSEREPVLARPELPTSPWNPLLDQIGAPMSGGRFDMSQGEDLMARLEEEDPDDVEEDGINVLTLDELFGDGFHSGLCRNGVVNLDGEDERGAWTATFDAATYFWFFGEPQAQMYPLTEECRAALLESGSLPSRAVGEGCDVYDEAAFFEEGSACRDCLSEREGDLDACEDSGECATESPREYYVTGDDGEIEWFDGVDATMFACAPDWTIEVILLAQVADDGTLPDSFDHERWGYVCYPYKAGRSIDYTCQSGYGGPSLGDALLEGVSARMIGVQYEGSEEVLHEGRMMYAHGLELEDGERVDYFWGFTPSGAGVISMPQIIPDSNDNGVVDIGDENFGFGLGGWGMNPHALRPDGTDPDNLDHTYARDWLATYVLKFSTAINGIPIHIFDHNRCAEGAWEGPFQDGSYRCTQLDAPEGEWLLDDVNNTWSDSTWTQAYAQPMATIASTGLPDMNVPTGAVPQVAGSAALSNPLWEGCTWPDQFVPDLAPMEDTPGIFGERASLWGHTWRFGKDPDMDLRAVLVTNRQREFCPPEGW